MKKSSDMTTLFITYFENYCLKFVFREIISASEITSYTNSGDSSISSSRQSENNY